MGFQRSPYPPLCSQNTALIPWGTLGWSKSQETISNGGPPMSWWSQALLTHPALQKHDLGCLWGVGSDMWVAGC